MSLCFFRIKDDNLKLNILEIDKLDNNVIKEWLKEKNMKVILLLGYEFNNFVLNLNDFKNIIFIEYQTRYGEITNIIKYNISIDWNLTINNALESKEFKKFLNNEIKITKYDYLVKNKNIILIEKYKKIKK